MFVSIFRKDKKDYKALTWYVINLHLFIPGVSQDSFHLLKDI